jgi:secreted trypsin-like serine protease
MSFVRVIALIALAVWSSGPSLAQEEIKPFGRRIVGGEKTDIKQHPWQVALRFKCRFFCGGSIIAQKWILTAAHCFEHSSKNVDWRAKAGATDYTSTGVWSDIERIVVHENYKPDTSENDIALIKLKAPAAGRVIPLAATSLSVPTGQLLEVTGWGATGTLPHATTPMPTMAASRPACCAQAFRRGAWTPARVTAAGRSCGLTRRPARCWWAWCPLARAVRAR